MLLSNHLIFSGYKHIDLKVFSAYLSIMGFKLGDCVSFSTMEYAGFGETMPSTSTGKIINYGQKTFKVLASKGIVHSFKPKELKLLYHEEPMLVEEMLTHSSKDVRKEVKNLQRNLKENRQLPQKHPTLSKISNFVTQLTRSLRTS